MPNDGLDEALLSLKDIIEFHQENLLLLPQEKLIYNNIEGQTTELVHREPLLIGD